MSADSSHAVAVALSKEFVTLSQEYRLDLMDGLVALETFIAISLAYAAIKTGQPDRRRYIQEILDVMTENCITRINEIDAKGKL